MMAHFMGLIDRSPLRVHSNLIVVRGDFQIMTTIRQIMTKFRRALDVYQ